jgi:hypothetical protein
MKRIALRRAPAGGGEASVLAEGRSHPTQRIRQFVHEHEAVRPGADLEDAPSRSDAGEREQRSSVVSAIACSRRAAEACQLAAPSGVDHAPGAAIVVVHTSAERYARRMLQNLAPI